MITRRTALCGSVGEWGFWGSGEVNDHLSAGKACSSGQLTQPEAERNVVMNDVLCSCFY